MAHGQAVAVPRADRVARLVPPQAWFGVSAIFHYLGPSLAVLLFPAVGPLGVVWFRIVAAAAVFGVWKRPWRTLLAVDGQTRWVLAALGACLALMNASFYLALDRLPVSLVASMEFVGTLAVALYGVRTARNGAALAAAGAGVYLLVGVQWASQPWGLFWSVLNSVLFVCYIILGHRLSQRGAGAGVEGLGAAMSVALLCITPIGLLSAVRVFARPVLVLAGIGVGLCSSVIPYVSDQFAMSRLPRASFSLMMALLPASATLMGAVVLRQIPSVRGLIGIGLVMAGIAVHRPADIHG